MSRKSSIYKQFLKGRIEDEEMINSEIYTKS